MKKSDNDKSGNKITLMKIICRLMPMICAGMPAFFAFSNIIGIMHGVSWGVNTLIIQIFFDTVSNAVDMRSGLLAVLPAAVLLGIVTIGSQLLNGLHNFMSGVFINKIQGILQMRINHKAAVIDPISYESPLLLDDINKAEEGMKNSLGLIFIFITLFTFYLPYFIFMGFYLFSLKPVLALSLILVFIPVMITQLIRGIVFARLEDKAAPVRREYTYYERCICDREYFKETRILGAFYFFRNLYHTTLELLRKKVWEAEFKTGLMEIGMKMMTLAGYFGILYLLFVSLLNGDISIGAFSAVFSSVGFIFGIMEEIVCRHIGNLTKNLGTVRNFIRFLDIPERKGKDVRIDAGKGVLLKNVSFRYPGAGTDSISGITLEISRGETIAIVGENGAGKTTLTKLMSGLYLPTEGSVYIDGKDTTEISAASVYRSISAVFQKYQRYKMTLNENICISDKDACTEDGSRLAETVVKADIDITGDSYPQGYDTMLSREFDGVDLSGGQWQRVAIARGFYRACGLIILDEPTASIDPIEETRIYMKFVEIAKNNTSVIVTHRLGSAKIADRIVVMDQGRIIAEGTHDDLMEAGGKYAEMYKAQAQWYVPKK